MATLRVIRIPNILNPAFRLSQKLKNESQFPCCSTSNRSLNAWSMLSNRWETLLADRKGNENLNAIKSDPVTRATQCHSLWELHRFNTFLLSSWERSTKSNITINKNNVEWTTNHTSREAVTFLVYSSRHKYRLFASLKL